MIINIMYTIRTLEAINLEKIYTSLGPTLKTIRQGKGYTQKYIVQDFMSRSFLAKIENATLNPTFSKFSIILKQLEMDSSEFEFIANKYQNTSKNEILSLFSRLSFSVERDKINFLINLCKEYKKQVNRKDVVVGDIMNICKALLFLQNNEVNNAKTVVLGIWDRLSKQDIWYLLELRMLNNIFFILPMDTASHIVKLALERLENYEALTDIKRLKVSFMLNFIQLKIFYGALDDELREYCQKSIEVCKELRLYDMLAISYIRSAIANKLNGDSETYLKKGFTILEAIDQKILVEEMKKEVKEVLGVNLLDNYKVNMLEFEK